MTKSRWGLAGVDLRSARSGQERTEAPAWRRHPLGADPHAELRERAFVWAREWCRDWEAAPVADRISLEFSPRLRRTLGRCQPDRARIRLAGWLVEAPEGVLREVVCHETAHAVVHALYGAGPRPHGVEWRTLMRAAGQPARARLPAEALPEALRRHTEPRLPVRHACPRCHATRNARRAMPHWRCGRCQSQGHDGRLTITRPDRDAERRPPAAEPRDARA